MWKTYRSVRSISYEVQIKINGRHQYVGFTGGTRTPRVILPYYKTNNEEIQKALESSASFNNSFILETKEEVEEVIKEEVKELEVITFANINLAKDFLTSEPYNIPRTKIPNLTAVENKAKSLGINIVIENNNNK
jgi:hypothetical protein